MDTHDRILLALASVFVALLCAGLV